MLDNKPKPHELCCVNQIYVIFEIRQNGNKICKKVFHNGLRKTSYQQALDFVKSNLHKNLVDQFIKNKKVKFLLY